MGRSRVVIDDRPLVSGRLIALNILVQGFDRAADERLGSLVSMLALRQFNEQPATRKQRIRETLLQRAEAVTPFLHRPTELDAVRLPLPADRLYVVHFERDMLHTLPVFFDRSEERRV